MKNQCQTITQGLTGLATQLHLKVSSDFWVVKNNYFNCNSNFNCKRSFSKWLSGLFNLTTKKVKIRFNFDKKRYMVV